MRPRLHGLTVASRRVVCDFRHLGHGLLDTRRSATVSVACPQGVPVLNVTFFGVRGSTPVLRRQRRRYGGNTACVVLAGARRGPDRARPGHRAALLRRDPARRRQLPRHGAGHPPPLGPRAGPAVLPARAACRAPASTSTPRCRRTAASVREAFDFFMRPPYFPVRVADLPSDIRCSTTPRGTDEGRHGPGHGAAHPARRAHAAATAIELGRGVVAYLPDHQQPLDGGFAATDAVLELADGVDLLIHDAQYTPAGVRPEVALGSLHLRVRRVRGQGGRRQAPGAVPPRPGPRRRRRSTRCCAAADERRANRAWRSSPPPRA